MPINVVDIINLYGVYNWLGENSQRNGENKMMIGSLLFENLSLNVELIATKRDTNETVWGSAQKITTWRAIETPFAMLKSY